MALVPSSSHPSGGGTQTVYVQDSDPGAAGFGKVWVDTSLDDAEVPVVKIRNDADDGWDSPLALFAVLQTEGNRLQNTEEDTSSRLNLGSNTAALSGKDGAASANGGSTNLEGGTGNDFAANGALVVAQGGRGTGAHGRARVVTDNAGGAAGQALVSDDASFLVYGGVRVAAAVPVASPAGYLPFAYDTTAVTGGLYFWNGAAWVKVANIL